MALIHPIVRYMVLCEDMIIQAKQISLIHLILNIRSRSAPRYPLLHEELCVFVVVAEATGSGTVGIDVLLLDTRNIVFATKRRLLQFGSDPLQAHGIPFRVKNCLFPEKGLYLVQFHFDGHVLAEQELYLR